MSGDVLMVVIAVMVLLVFLALALAAWLAYQNVQLAKSAQSTSAAMLEIVDKQAALIASEDALAYQAIRAADLYGTYDGLSAPAEVEEIDGGDGSDRGIAPEEAGFGGDPFVTGTVFGSRL